MKSIKFLIVLLFFATSVFSQDANEIIKKLKEELAENPIAKRKATIYSDLTWYYTNISLDSAMAYGKKAIIESTKLGDSTLIAQVYSDMGAVYFRNNDFTKSKKSYLEAYSIRKFKKDEAGMAKINVNLANIYQKNHENKFAMQTYLKAIDYFSKNNNPLLVSTIEANIGIVFNEMKNYKKAIQYLNSALIYQEKNNLTDKICTTCITLGNSNLRLKDTAKAIFYYNKSLSACKISGNRFGTISVMNNLAVVKLFQKKTNEVIELNQKSDSIKSKLVLDKSNAQNQLILAQKDIMYSRFKEGKEKLLNLKSYFVNNKLDEDVLVTYQYLINSSAYLNQPDSVNYYTNKAFDLQTVITEKSVNKQTFELETKYQTSKKEKQIIKQAAEAKQKNFLLLGLSIFAILIGLVGFLIYHQQRLKNKQQEQEFQLKSAISQIETQNKLQDQRLSISRDLHDNIGAQLTFIISSVDNIKYGFEIENPKLDNKLTNISCFAKDTIVELRDTIWAMNSNEITYEDLQSRINNFMEKAKETMDEISFSFAVDEALKLKKLSSVQGMNIYRTIQEAINNAIKYADANIISVNIKKQDNQTKIKIQDNGKGFDQETIEKGNGLKNMQKRIEEIGGKFSLYSDNEGTKIEIFI